MVWGGPGNHEGGCGEDVELVGRREDRHGCRIEDGSWWRGGGCKLQLPSTCMDVSGEQ